jgi:autotransporter-associated beta strand protein
MPGVNAYILDADGDPVWWFSGGRGASGVVMSYDGNYMWINSVNFPDRGAFVHRVSMDGLTDEDLSSQFVDQSHQLAVLPDETVAFNAVGANSCDDIKERAPDGTVRTIVNSLDAHGGTGGCHVNNVQYSPWDDTLVFSDLLHQDITKVTRTGATVWVLNGDGNTFTGDAWVGGQHGVDLLGLDDLVIFSNNSAMQGGTATGSSAIEMKLNVTAMTSTQIWSYTASPGIQNDVMGDVQRLPNGNTIVAYSTKGVVEEVNVAGTLLQTWTWPASDLVLGYIQKRATLYGPPPR